MKPFSSIVLFFILIGFSSLISNNSQKNKNDKASILISTSWAIHEVYMNNKMVENSPSGKRYFKFEKDGNFTYTAESGPVPGKWSLSSNQKKLIMTGGFEATFNIKFINEKQIVLIRTFEDNGIKTKAEFRLVPMK